MLYEEELLKKLFNVEGDLQNGGISDFEFKVKDSPDYDYATIRLNGNKAELYSTPHPKFEPELEEVAELSDEDIVSLKKTGYEWL